MTKSDIDHIQRSRFLAKDQKKLRQIDFMVQIINLRYPELARNIEISEGISINKCRELGHVGNVINKWRWNFKSKLLA